MSRRKSALKDRARRDAEFLARRRRLKRLQNWVGAFGFIPLAAVFACTGTAGALPFCAIPREWLYALWAGVFGTFIGLSIRLYRERRRYERGQL
jgi:hypothetical protein